MLVKNNPSQKTSLVLLFFYSCMGLQFIRYYINSTVFYLNMPAYLSGKERLPFQERVFPIFLIYPLTHTTWITSHLHQAGPFTADHAGTYCVSLLGFALGAIYTQKLYLLMSRTRALSFVVYPVFLFAIMWSYNIHNEANYSYPYDLPGVAFFAAGLYFIYARRFLPLILVIFFGTLNRETTLFLIGIYVLDGASTLSETLSPGWLDLRQRFSLRAVSWARVALLACVWLGVKMALAHYFSHNDNSENYVRIKENLGRMKPRLIPALLNMCGYLVPLVIVFYRRIRPIRYANYLYIVPVWFAVMFYTGVLIETRIYGELSPLVTVAAVLMMEHYASSAVLKFQERVPIVPSVSVGTSVHGQDALPHSMMKGINEEVCVKAGVTPLI